jgi:nucleotide-binding universal stress UspA family protein
MYRRILAAQDGSDGAQRAFDAAVSQTLPTPGATPQMVRVDEELPKHAEIMDQIVEVKEQEDSYFGQPGAQARRRAAMMGVPLETSAVSGHEVKSTIEFARSGGLDLLAAGHTGHPRMYEHLWGGTPQNLTRLAPCSVRVVK